MVDLTARKASTARSSMLSVVDQGLVSVGNFATSIVVGRLAGLDGLGTYSLGFALLIIASAVHESFVAIPYTIYGNRLDPADRRKLAGSSLVHALLIGAALMALLITIGLVVWLSHGSADVRDVLFIVAAVMVLTMVREFARRHAFAELRVGTAVVIDGVALLVQAIGLGALAVMDSVTTPWVVAVIGAAAGVTGLGWFLATKADIQIDRADVGPTWRRHWVYGRWVAAARLTSVTHGYVVNWILAAVLTIGAAGGYAAAATMVAATNPLLTGVAMVLTPFAARAFAEGGHAEVRLLAAKATAAITLLAIALAIPLVVFGGTVLRIVFGSEFGDYGATIAVLALGLVVGVVGMGAEAGLRAVERPSVSFVASAVGLVATIVVTLLLAPRYGAIGGAWGVVVGEGIVTIIECGVFFGRADHANSESFAADEKGG